jgi:hypothetical protein
VDFEQWVARHHGSTSDALSRAGETILLQEVATLGPHGKNASEYLRINQRIRSWYAKAKIPLIRHLAAVVLLEKVLHPFAFGLSPEVSQAFSWVDTDMMSRGGMIFKFSLII